MRLDYKSTRITLDWDNISIEHAKNYVKKIFRYDKDIKRIILKQSAYKGWHVIIYYDKPVSVALYRQRYNDDGRRLIHDLFNPDYIHDVLWKKKRIHNIEWIAPDDIILELKR